MSSSVETLITYQCAGKGVKSQEKLVGGEIWLEDVSEKVGARYWQQDKHGLWEHKLACFLGGQNKVVDYSDDDDDDDDVCVCVCVYWVF